VNEDAQLSGMAGSGDLVETSFYSAKRSRLLQVIYPLHCRIAAAVENTICGGLTPVQASILWMFRQHVAMNHRRANLPRKEIAQWVNHWFGFTGAAVSHAIRGMSSPPLALVRLVKDSSSRREKLVRLTARGEQFLISMEERGQLCLELIERELPEEQLWAGVSFLSAFALAVEKIDARDVAGGDGLKKRMRSLGSWSNHPLDGRLPRSIHRKGRRDSELLRARARNGNHEPL
jgi:DNA-binding MarR family transcriptional regulator